MPLGLGFREQVGFEEKWQLGLSPQLPKSKYLQLLGTLRTFDWLSLSQEFSTLSKLID